MDTPTCAFVQLQQIISHSLDFLYSGTDSPSGLQRKCDYLKVISSFDAQLRAWWIEWGNDSQSPYHPYLDFQYHYASLVLNSFGLQNALESTDAKIHLSYFFNKVYTTSEHCAMLVRDRVPKGTLGYFPDTCFVQMSYAVLSLLKVSFSFFFPLFSLKYFTFFVWHV